MRAWLRVHKWSSLGSTSFLLVLCLTGLPLVFHDELSQRSLPAVPLAASAVGTAVTTLDRICERERTGPRRRFVQFVFWEDDEPARVGLGVAQVPDAPLEQVTRVLVDAKSGEGGVQLPPESPVLTTLLDLHRNLCAGEVGDAVLGLMALLFVTSTVSGVVIYGPFMRNLDFGTVRRRSQRLRWLDLHNLIGIATAIWALVVGATGLMNTLEARLFAAWQDQELPALLATDNPPRVETPNSSVDTALIRARAALPTMQVVSIGLAGTRYGTPRHHLAWMHGTTTLTKRLFTPVLVDSLSGSVVMAKPLPWYLRLLEASRPLHFGDYGGLPLKLIWAGFDLILISILSSGLYLWGVKWLGVRAHSQPVSARAEAAAEL